MNLDHLPDDPALLKGLVRELLATHHAQQRQIDQLTHRLDLLLKRVVSAAERTRKAFFQISQNAESVGIAPIGLDSQSSDSTIKSAK